MVTYATRGNYDDEDGHEMGRMNISTHHSRTITCFCACEHDCNVRTQVHCHTAACCGTIRPRQVRTRCIKHGHILRDDKWRKTDNRKQASEIYAEREDGVALSTLLLMCPIKYFDSHMIMKAYDLTSRAQDIIGSTFSQEHNPPSHTAPKSSQ
jgi:hypothetical protein